MPKFGFFLTVFCNVSCSIIERSSYYLRIDCNFTFFIFQKFPYTCFRVTHVCFELMTFGIFWKTIAETHWCRKIRALEPVFHNLINFLKPKNDIHLHTPIIIAFLIKYGNVQRYGAHNNHESTLTTMIQLNNNGAFSLFTSPYSTHTLYTNLLGITKQRQSTHKNKWRLSHSLVKNT